MLWLRLALGRRAPSVSELPSISFRPTPTPSSKLTILNHAKVVRLPLHNALEILQVLANLINLGGVELLCVVFRLVCLLAIVGA